MELGSPEGHALNDCQPDQNRTTYNRRRKREFLLAQENTSTFVNCHLKLFRCLPSDLGSW